MYAIIKTNGKQYKVEAELKFQMERVAGEEGSEVTFDQVLMVAEEGKVSVGDPLVKGAVVTARILKQYRGPKVIVFKMKRRKRSRVKQGHRQDMTSLQITGITLA